MKLDDREKSIACATALGFILIINWYTSTEDGFTWAGIITCVGLAGYVVDYWYKKLFKNKSSHDDM